MSPTIVSDGTISASMPLRDVVGGEQVVVPLAGLEVEHHRARGVRELGDERLAPGEVPDQPGVDGAGEQLAALGALLGPGDGVQDEADLRGGVVRVRDEARPLLDHVAVALLDPLLDDVDGLPGGPHHGVVDGPARVLLPDDARLALVGQRDRGQVGGLELGLAQRGADDLELDVEDLDRVVLDPARARVVLGQLRRGEAEHLALVVDDECARAGGAFVDSENVLGHAGPASSSSEVTASSAGPDGHAALAHCGPGNARHAGRPWSSTCTHLYRPLWSARRRSRRRGLLYATPYPVVATRT